MELANETIILDPGHSKAFLKMWNFFRTFYCCKYTSISCAIICFGSFVLIFLKKPSPSPMVGVSSPIDAGSAPADTNGEWMDTKGRED